MSNSVFLGSFFSIHVFWCYIIKDPEQSQDSPDLSEVCLACCSLDGVFLYVGFEKRKVSGSFECVIFLSFVFVALSLLQANLCHGFVDCRC